MISEKTYGLNQLRYDLRKLKGHGLIERDGSRYAYRLTQKGVQVALLFLFFHKRLCGPLANSRFHHRPDTRSTDPIAVSKPPITVPIPPFNASLTLWQPLESQALRLHDCPTRFVKLRSGKKSKPRLQTLRQLITWLTLCAGP